MIVPVPSCLCRRACAIVPVHRACVSGGGSGVVLAIHGGGSSGGSGVVRATRGGGTTAVGPQHRHFNAGSINIQSEYIQIECIIQTGCIQIEWFVDGCDFGQDFGQGCTIRDSNKIHCVVCRVHVDSSRSGQS